MNADPGITRSKFVLVREKPGEGLSDLPGNPIAIVRSQDADLDLLILCTVKSDHEKLLEQVKKDISGAGIKRKRTPLDDRKKEEDEIRQAMIDRRMGKGGDSEPPEKHKDDSSSDESVDPYAKKTTKKVKRDEDVKGVLKRQPPTAEAAAEAFEGGSLAATVGFAPASKKKTNEKYKVASSVAITRHSMPADFIRLPMGSFFEPLPEVDPETRSAEFMAGRPKSGKSYYASRKIVRYQKLFPKRPVYGICHTKLKNDPSYAKLGIKQLPLNFFDTFDIETAFPDTGCLVLFEDWDSLPAAIKKNVLKAIEIILNVGRKLQISIFVTTHLLSNYNETRTITHESNVVTLFPQNEMIHSIKYLCQKLGVDPDVQARLRDKGRWVSIHSAQPTYVLSETEAEMV